ncbi:hypothetical protein SAMN06265222_102375 [Neorhodopirellula lusitana]|uniref:Uncharacterized protein n=2 Tax=Neorhodopirellula lusitana TaxID=445327 RepID=A0ABY1PW16_9BACT|nr:hypothetical protein SAMN06265222_102375 [Neorhodopirellula lusitana]
MNTPRENCHLLPLYSPASLPQRSLQLLTVLVCVFCLRSIQADQPVAASNPVMHERVSNGESARKQKSNQLIPENTSVVPNSSDKAQKLTNRGDGTGAALGGQAINSGIIRLKFQGSYEVSMEGVGVARGTGTTTLE